MLIDDNTRIVWGPLQGARFTGSELICRMGIYELHVQYALREMLNQGDVFYDVGANNGYLSLLGARLVGAGGMVYAFEPLPQNARKIRALLLENRVEGYELVQMAVSDQTGSARLYLGDDQDPYTSSMIRNRRSSAIWVDATTLDEFAGQHRWPSLIKIDIEGAEIMALDGASKLLIDPSAPKWLIEVHSGELDQQVRKILSGHGYHLRGLPAPFSQKQYPAHLAAWKKNVHPSIARRD